MGGGLGTSRASENGGSSLDFQRDGRLPASAFPPPPPTPPISHFSEFAGRGCPETSSEPGLLPAGASRHSREMGGGGGGRGWRRVVRGVGRVPWGLLTHPGCSSRQEPLPPPAPQPQALQAPQGVHTELLRFMRPRKVDRLCRPVDTELMAERCAPLHRQRCEGVSL